MRGFVIAALGIALLVVLWWRSDVPPAPVAGADAASAVEQAPGATVAAADASLAPRVELAPAPRSWEDASVATAAASRGRVRGKLVDPAGRGVRGEVWRWEASAREDAIPEEYDVMSDGPRAVPSSPEGRTWTSDSGAFEIDLPLGRRIALMGRRADFACSSLCFVELTDAEPSAVVTLRLQERTEIRGRIFDDRGVPIATAVLTALPEPPSAAPWNGEVYGQQRAAVSDADGAFAFENLSPHATFTLTYVPERDSAVRSTRTGIRAGDLDVRFVVASDEVRTGRVTGVVRDAKGAPLPRFDLSIGSASTTSVDAEGRFSIDGLPWGRAYPIFVSVPEGSFCPQSVGICRIDRPEQELALQLEAEGKLTVCVREASGEAVAGAMVFLTQVFAADVDASSVSADPRVSDAEGRADFGALGPGTYMVSASAGRRSARDTITILPGAGASMELRLRRPGALTVVVRDDAGAPLRDVHVAVVPEPIESGQSIAGWHAVPAVNRVFFASSILARGNTLVFDGGPDRNDQDQPITDGDGCAYFRALDPGRYRIFATVDGQSAEATAEVMAGGSASVELRIKR